MISPSIIDVETIDRAVPLPSAPTCQRCGVPAGPSQHFCVECRQSLPRRDESAADTQSTTFACQTCGARVRFEDGRRSERCPFCNTAYVATGQSRGSGPEPEFVIGFTITHHRATEIFRRWLTENRWFHPGDLAEQSVIDRAVGVYLPFWSFTCRIDSDWSARIGEYWYRTETYTTTDAKGRTVTRTRTVQETEWWPLAGRRHRYATGYYVSASAGLAQDEAESIQPYDLPAMVRYDPGYLAGWAAEDPQVDAPTAWKTFQAAMEARERSLTAAFLPGDTHTGLQVQCEFSGVAKDLMLLPVHVLCYQYRGKLYRFLINGQTGRCVGRRPVSGAKVSLAIAVLAVAILVVLLLFVAAGGR